MLPRASESFAWPVDRSMASRDDIVFEITPQVLLKAYSCGIFPMAESADDPALYWIEPQHRGILPLDKLHVPAPARAHGAHNASAGPHRHRLSPA